MQYFVDPKTGMRFDENEAKGMPGLIPETPRPFTPRNMDIPKVMAGTPPQRTLGPSQAGPQGPGPQGPRIVGQTPTHSLTNTGTGSVPKQRGLLGQIGDFMGSDKGKDLASMLAIGLEGMTMNPNQGLIEMNARGIEERKGQRNANRTAEIIRTKFKRPDLAQMVESGAITGQEAMALLNTGAKPLSSIAKLRDDLNSGRITQAEYDLALQSMQKGDGVRVNVDLSEGQAGATAFLNRMQANSQVIDALDTQGTEFMQRLLGQVPVAGDFLTTPQYKMFDTAARNWIASLLRKDSGATITPEEYEEGMRQYFPQPGDDEGTIDLKRRLRKAAEYGMGIQAGAGAGMTQQAVLDEADAIIGEGG